MASPLQSKRIVYARMPHHVAPSADAPPFRFAMVHDVIHERYPRHGAAFYRECERLARERLAVVHPDLGTAAAAIDDIAVGLDRQGKTDEAITLMRDKLKRQLTLMRPGDELYSSNANLGEFLIHQNLMGMLGGDAKARTLFEEGRNHLRTSLTIDPKARFGQEEWQFLAINALLDAGETPLLMRKWDLIGNRLDKPIEIGTSHRAPFQEERFVFGRPYHEGFIYGLYTNHREYTKQIDNPIDRRRIRELIYQVGGERADDDSGEPTRGRRAPFHEPALWIIGEWRQRSGPSPHLALCLGEIMLRVGQRYLAWDCYKRAVRLANQYAPQEHVRAFLRDHSRKRQLAIEKSLSTSEVATLRPKFESELAFGESYQRDYQAYTEQKIRAGVSLSDPNFFDEFNASRPPIASKVGPEEWYAGDAGDQALDLRFRDFWMWGLFSGGAVLLIISLMAHWRSRRRNEFRFDGASRIRPTQSPAPP
jgi:hypothetical protein